MTNMPALVRCWDKKKGRWTIFVTAITCQNALYLKQQKHEDGDMAYADEQKSTLTVNTV